MGNGKMLAGRRRTVRRGVVATGGAALTVAVALALTAGRGTGPRPDHGPVVARLPIPFRAAGAEGKTDIIPVRVRVGQRFSIWVDAVAYYAFWREATMPEPHVARAAGDFAAGTCPAQVAGCSIPYLYSFVARSRGTTTMTWEYRQGYTHLRPSVTLVAVKITVR